MTPMLREFINFLLYNETNEMVQKNVQTLAQLTLLYVFYMVYYVFLAEKTSVPSYDIPIVLIVFGTWYGIKKYKIYYTRLLFLVIVPLFNYAIYDMISRNGLVGVLWSFPLILGLYFCFYKRTALLAVSITFVVTMLACLSVMSSSNFFSSFITLLMVVICFSTVVFNFYRQYDFVKDQVKIDSLTNILNRSALEEVLLDSIENQAENLPPILLYFDLDNFKYINDTFGHAVGDLALINLSKLLQSHSESEDSVFRLGGEEFLVVLRDISLSHAEFLAETIRTDIEDSNLIENGHVVTSSIGMAVYRQNEGWDQWLKRADDAMYKAKKSGKNQVILIN